MKIQDKETFDKVNVFGQGEENSAFAQYFIGNSYLNPLTKPGESPIFLSNVTFEPGCRNNWHIHHAKTGGGRNPAGSQTLARSKGRQLVLPYRFRSAWNRDQQ